LFAFGFTNAQAPLEEGGLQLNAGLGTSGWEHLFMLQVYGIATNFTIGGELSYQSTKFWSRSRNKSSIFWNSSK
jgi:hypothetical protein